MANTVTTTAGVQNPAKLESSFSFTNNEAATVTMPLVALDLTKNYSKFRSRDWKEKDGYPMTNNTTTLDQPELFTTRYRELQEVFSYLPNLYPPRVTGGIECGGRLDELYRTYLPNGEILQDTPIIAFLSVKTIKNAVISDEIVTEIVHRLISGLSDPVTGNLRFNELLRGSIEFV